MAQPVVLAESAERKKGGIKFKVEFVGIDAGGVRCLAGTDRAAPNTFSTVRVGSIFTLGVHRNAHRDWAASGSGSGAT